jgi:hypothetical protein
MQKLIILQMKKLLKNKKSELLLRKKKPFWAKRSIGRRNNSLRQESFLGVYHQERGDGIHKFEREE